MAISLSWKVSWLWFLEVDRVRNESLWNISQKHSFEQLRVNLCAAGEDSISATVGFQSDECLSQTMDKWRQFVTSGHRMASRYGILLWQLVSLKSNFTLFLFFLMILLFAVADMIY